MAKTMTPSAVMTDGQIDKAVEVYRAMLKKHRSELGSKEVQQILSRDDYVGEQVGVLRRCVEAVSDLIIRSVDVNRNRTPQEALAATGRVQYVDNDVVNSMPRGKGNTKKVVFFKESRFISDDDLEKKYELRGLVPVDPYSLAAVNEKDPAFADTHPNVTHWKDSNGKWCYAAFNLWDGKRNVNVHRNGHDWYGSWWFAGVSK